ncbi:unnamed protein product, partial [Rhizoctonia solani]
GIARLACALPEEERDLIQATTNREKEFDQCWDELIKNAPYLLDLIMNCNDVDLVEMTPVSCFLDAPLGSSDQHDVSLLGGWDNCMLNSQNLRGSSLGQGEAIELLRSAVTSQNPTVDSAQVGLNSKLKMSWEGTPVVLQSVK